MKKVSIVISSLRPAKLEEAIDSTQQYHDEIEMVIVSPYPPKPREFVTHIPVPNINEPGELTFVQKVNLGFKHTSGKFVAFCNDDFLFNEEWLPEFLKFMEENENARHPFLAAFCQSIGEGSKTGMGIFGLRYTNFGGMSREDFNRLGGFIFHEGIYMHYGDVDLGVRVWDKGGEVKLCDKVILENRDASDNIRRISAQRWLIHDERVFFDKWFSKYGISIERKLLESEIHLLLSFVNKPMEWFEATTDWQAQLPTLLRKILRFGFLPDPVRTPMIRLGRVIYNSLSDIPHLGEITRRVIKRLIYTGDLTH